MNWAQTEPGGQPRQQGSGDPWSGPTARFDASNPGDPLGQSPQIELITPNRPPMLWLAVAGLLTLAGLVVGLIGRSATFGLIGWALAGPLAISAIALFSTADAKQRESGWYTPSLLADWGRRLVIVVALVVVALCAWFIANDVARGVWR